jgi:hypothetical protein
MLISVSQLFMTERSGRPKPGWLRQLTMRVNIRLGERKGVGFRLPCLTRWIVAIIRNTPLTDDVALPVYEVKLSEVFVFIF